MSVAQLRALEPETWGERLGRARNRADLSLKEVAARVSHLHPVSYSTLMRLESMRRPPTDARRRIVAYLAAVVCGFDPEDFDLSSDDLPRWITPEVLDEVRLEYAGQKADLGIAKKPCNALSAA